MKNQETNKSENRNFSFENLEVYSKIRNLIKYIYQLQEKFPKEERYGLGDQVRRAVVSVSANLAEGSGRNSLKEKIHFVEISYGSLMEVFCELQAACDLKYITTEQFNSLRPQITDIAKMLSGLRNAFQSRLTNP
ncbi:MAG: four helix bundle protein [Bacteroidales bacterium]|nr:four helix bundle protein [Bacteroidales bacterium]